MRKILLAAVAATALGGAAQAGVLVTFEGAGVLNTTAGFDHRGVETFAGRSGSSFTTDFGTAGLPTTITGTYNGVELTAANVYGGADNDTYAAAWTEAGYTLSLSAAAGGNPVPVTYFGYWLSALDGGNRLELLRNGQVVFSLNPADVIAAVGGCAGGTNAYCGNPVAGPERGGNGGEPYVFVNFFEQTGRGFDTVRFFESPRAGGYESDNHTVGIYRTTSGTVVPVPEPASMAVFGAGLLGLGLARAARRRG